MVSSPQRFPPLPRRGPKISQHLRLNLFHRHQMQCCFFKIFGVKNTISGFVWQRHFCFLADWNEKCPFFFLYFHDKGGVLQGVRRGGLSSLRSRGYYGGVGYALPQATAAFMPSKGEKKNSTITNHENTKEGKHERRGRRGGLYALPNGLREAKPMRVLEGRSTASRSGKSYIHRRPPFLSW